MNDVKITEIDSGVRALTDTELMMVAGGGSGPGSLGSPNFWWNVAKMVAIGSGSAAAGPLGAVLPGVSVIFVQSCVQGDGPYDACYGTPLKPATPGAEPM